MEGRKAWKKLKEAVLANVNPQSPEELRKVSSALLVTFVTVSDEKRQLVKELEENLPTLKEFEDAMKFLSTKGYAYDERALWRRLGEPEQIKLMRKYLAETEIILDGCKNIERQLNMVKETFRLEAKLSYEGH